MERYCSRCKITKDVELFTNANITNDGSRGLCKSCKSKGDAEYRKTHKKQISEHASKRWRESPEIRKKNKLYKNLSRTGLDASEFVKDKVCESCGMTNPEHIKKYNERLHIHHKNNDGRHNIRLGQSPIHEDLKVLCRSCHVSEDNKNRDYTGRGYKIWETRKKNERLQSERQSNNNQM